MNDSHAAKNEIVEFVRVLVKHGYLILTGTLIITLIIGLSNYFSQSTYNIGTVLRPGIIRINDDGKRIFIESPSDIRSMIETGALNGRILDSLQHDKGIVLPKKLSFDVEASTDSDIIKIDLISTDTDAGKKILSKMIQLLIERNEDQLDYFKDQMLVQMRQNQFEIKRNENSIESKKNKIKKIEDRITKLNIELGNIRNNITSLESYKNNSLQEIVSNDDNYAIMLYTNTIQQYIELTGTYVRELSEYEIRKESQLIEIAEIRKVNQGLRTEIENLKSKLEQIKNLQVLQSPTVDPFAIKPKIVRNIALAGLLGLFVMITTAFLIEFIQLYRKKVDAS